MSAGRRRHASTLDAWRARRRARRLLRELNRFGDGVARPWARRRERVRSVLAVVGVITLLMVAWRVNTPAGSFSAAFGSNEDVELLPVGPVGPGLARPAEVATEAGVYRFRLVHSSDGSPISYDSCHPIELVVNPAGAPPGADALLADSVAQVEAASGLDIDIVGETDERPQDDRPAQLREYGPGWAPSLIAWSDPDETPRLEGDVAGLAGSAYSRSGDEVAYVSGSVTLDGPQFTGHIEADEVDRVRAIIVHELAHLVGLQHVADPGELMYPRSQAGVTELQGGDLAGLAALGRGGCTDW